MAISWHQWADLFLDSGYDLYAFWQLSTGKLLYRDISYYHGPLSPLFCAWVFRLFGVSIETLAITSFLLVVVMAVLIYEIFRSVGDVTTALAVSLFFLVVFAFSQYIPIANFNFIFPYKFEALHGTLILVALIYFLSKDTAIAALCAGVLAGSAIMTSAEIVLAGAGLSLLGLFYLPHRARIAFVATVPVVPIIFLVYLRTYLAWDEAFTYCFRSIVLPLQHPEISNNAFFRELSGTANLSQNLPNLIRSTIGALIVASLVTAADRLTNLLSNPLRRALAFAPGVILFACIAEWILPLRSFPDALSGTSLILLAYALGWKQHRTFQLWTIFSLLFLMKIFFNPKFHHYGFYLSMPATLQLIYASCFLLPNTLSARWPNGGQFAAPAGLGIFIGLGVLWCQISLIYFESKTYFVGRGGDAILTHPPNESGGGIATNAAIHWIKENTSTTDKILTLPEGNMLNYLSRRERPNSDSMNYIEYAIQGEQKLLAGWRVARPEFVVLVHRDMQEFGLPRFGTENYGTLTMRWINENYHQVYLIGSTPFQPNNFFGIAFMKRNDLH